MALASTSLATSVRTPAAISVARFRTAKLTNDGTPATRSRPHDDYGVQSTAGILPPPRTLPQHCAQPHTLLSVERQPFQMVGSDGTPRTETVSGADHMNTLGDALP